MPDNPYEDDVSRFAGAFMRAVIAWNNAEEAAREILVAFGGNSIGLRIASEQLQARSMKEALLSLCDALSSVGEQRTKAVAEHIAHFIEGLDTLRAYRNFYVHSLRSTGRHLKDLSTYIGFLHSTEAKGRLAFIKHELTTDDLEQFMNQTLTLQQYGQHISMCIPRELHENNALKLVVKDAQLWPLPDKPTWPDKLRKHRSYLTAPQHPPGSSQA
jgi:hypothetical protein